ncbi:GFA family protein [Candidatus Binatia bacterium]|nr:GFA family protein [Candidatus Binatia bacterium]
MRASCLCGDVVWEGSGPGELVHHCHCGICRKISGTAFTTMGGVPASSFRFVRGGDGIRRFRSSPGSERCFCGRCGSTVPGEAFGDTVFVPFGNVEGDPGGRPVAHIFVASKAPWYELPDDGLPRFDAYPPGYADPELFPAEPRGGSDGRVGGSCLCGAIAYELEKPVDAWHNCHCSRCRRGRGGAHASNLFLDARRFRLLRGGDAIDSFKVPEAERFTQSFCRTCGGKAPRINVQAGYAAVPAGSLDDDPGARPERHIYVASKAPWFEIADRLPQFSAFIDS